jgi:hypothetical protein
MIIDRTNVRREGEDYFLVTGSIGPDFQPKIFSSRVKAMHYARAIDRYETFPAFKPVIECRSELCGLELDV